MAPFCAMTTRAPVLRSLFAQLFFDSFTRGVGKLVRRGVSEFLGMLVDGAAQEANLMAIAAAHPAEQQMEAQPCPFGQMQRALQFVGLEPGRLPTCGHKGAEPPTEGRQ